MFIFLEKAKEAPNPNVKILCPESKSVSILHQKKPERTILSIPNVFHRKDNPIHNCMLSQFYWQGQLYHYTALIYNDLCLYEQ